MCAAETQALEPIAASFGWISEVVRRHSLRSVSLRDEAGPIDIHATVESIVFLRGILSEVKVQNIFNVDETGLFFNLLALKTYICTHGDRKSFRGQGYEFAGLHMFVLMLIDR